MSAWTSALMYAAVEEAVLPRCSLITHLSLASPLELLAYLSIHHELTADHLEMTETLKSRRLISSTVPFWSFRSTGPLLASGKDLQTAEEVSILSLVVLMDISSTYITALSKSLPDSWTMMERLTISIVKEISTGYPDDVTCSGITGMKRHTIPLKLLTDYIVHDRQLLMS